MTQLQAVEIARGRHRNRFDVLGVTVVVVVFFRSDFDVEAAQVQDRGNVDVRIPRLADTRGAVQIAQLEFELGQILGIDQVDLVEQHHIGEGNLLLRLRRIAQLLEDMLGIDDGDDAVQLILALDSIVDKEALDYGGWIGEAGSLDHQRVELVPVFEETKQTAQQVAAHGAADAAVAHLDDFLVGRNQQVMIDADFAEFVHNHGHATTVVGGQDSIE